MKFKLWISLLVIMGILLVPVQFIDAVAFIQGTISYFDDLLDVNATAPADGYIVYWNNTTGYWEARAESTFNCTDLASCNLTALENVDTSSLVNYDFLIYNNYTGMWENEILSSVALQIAANMAVQQIGNVNASLLDGYILYYDTGASEFRMRLESTFNCGDLASCNISELAYVNATSPSDNDILFWNNTASEWQTKAESGAFNCTDLNTCNITSLGDVNVAPSAKDTFFVWNDTAGEWQARELLAADIPNLDTAKITTGTFIMARLPTEIKTAGIIFIIDGVGTTITTGEKGHLEIPFNCTIQQATMVADQSGSIVVDIWKDTYDNFPPTNADTITSATPPTITTAQKSQDTTLTNWTTTIASGDILAYNVDSCTNITRVTVSLEVLRT